MAMGSTWVGEEDRRLLNIILFHCLGVEEIDVGVCGWRMYDLLCL